MMMIVGIISYHIGHVVIVIFVILLLGRGDSCFRLLRSLWFQMRCLYFQICQLLFSVFFMLYIKWEHMSKSMLIMVVMETFVMSILPIIMMLPILESM